MFRGEAGINSGYYREDGGQVAQEVQFVRDVESLVEAYQNFLELCRFEQSDQQNQLVEALGREVYFFEHEDRTAGDDVDEEEGRLEVLQPHLRQHSHLFDLPVEVRRVEAHEYVCQVDRLKSGRVAG